MQLTDTRVQPPIVTLEGTSSWYHLEAIFLGLTGTQKRMKAAPNRLCWSSPDEDG